MERKVIVPMVKNAGSRTLQEATTTLEPDLFPTLGLIQASRMTSLVSDNLMGASLSLPTPLQEKSSCVEADKTPQAHLISSTTTV